MQQLSSSPPLWPPDSSSSDCSSDSYLRYDRANSSSPAGDKVLTRTRFSRSPCFTAQAAYRLPVSFSPPVPGGAVGRTAALAGRRSGALGAAGLLRAAAGSDLAEHLPSLDAVTTRCWTLEEARISTLKSLFRLLLCLTLLFHCIWNKSAFIPVRLWLSRWIQVLRVQPPDGISHLFANFLWIIQIYLLNTIYLIYFIDLYWMSLCVASPKTFSDSSNYVDILSVCVASIEFDFNRCLWLLLI